MDCEELEIVQYKFASIIGGLCGKPKILSQFAVWLDLRLAEYKLKGAISLDCSGSTPDPDWLQGIKPDLSQQTQTFLSEHVSAEQTNESVLYGDAIHHIPSEQTGHVQSDQIKAEPYSEESVFPVGQYENVGITCTNNSQSTPAKYKARSEQFGSPSSKLRKVVQSTAANEDFSNVGTTPGLSSEPEEVTIDDDSESYESFTAGISSDFSQAPSTSAAQPRTSRNDNRRPNIQRISTRKHRLKNHESLPQKTVRNVLAAVSSLERWLWCHRGQESRLVEDIPPGELNSYLKDYFMSVKKPSGQDYTYSSFASLRAGIERYLRDKDYPEPISTSPSFHETRIAFRSRKRELENSYVDPLLCSTALAFDNSATQSWSNR